MLFKNFNNYLEKTALILPNNTHITYFELQKQVNNVAHQLGDKRKLIFIEVNNNLASILSYIACIQNNHPVLLLNAESKAQNHEIIECYQPNIVVDAKGDTPQINIKNENDLNLHSDLCLLLATSGSTGSPKLVKLSHNNIFSNTQSISSYLELNDTDRAITSLKFNYSYGLSIINSHLHMGAAIVITNSSTNDPCFWQLFSEHKVTSFSGVPYNFELLAKQQFEFKDFPALRSVTQAGGKLSTFLIKHFADMGNKYHYKFYVMYGQTEASPRISYLPPEYCISHCDFIGIPIPGGTIELLDVHGDLIKGNNIPGELIYKGPNVMLGYAKNFGELSTKENITWLHTGDIAIRNENNLFKITGRKSRFAKPFGIRVSLDDIQNELSELAIINAVTSYNELIVIAIESYSTKLWPQKNILDLLEKKYQINRVAFSIHIVESLPLLSNGKVDFKGIKNLVISSKQISKNKIKLFLHFFKEEFLHLAGIKNNTWNNLIEMYSHFFNDQQIHDTSSFISHAGDSLLYVSISIELERYLGHLPNEWHLQTLDSLEKLRNNNDL